MCTSGPRSEGYWLVTTKNTFTTPQSTVITCNVYSGELMGLFVIEKNNNGR